MKKCTVCKQQKIETEFYKNKSKPSGLQEKCKQCQRLCFKQRYSNNKQYYIDKREERVSNAKDWLNDYKSNLSCDECGFDHPAALDFHHVDKFSKTASIGTLVLRGWTLGKILEEIAKCRVLCSNCHRILHYEQRINCEGV